MEEWKKLNGKNEHLCNDMVKAKQSHLSQDKADNLGYTQAGSSAVGEATLACSNYQRDLGTEGEQPLEIGR